MVQKLLNKLPEHFGAIKLHWPRVKTKRKKKKKPYISSHWNILKITFIKACRSSIIFYSGFLTLYLNIAIVFQPIWNLHFPATSAHNHISFWISRQLHTVWQSNFRTEHLCSTNTMQQRKKMRAKYDAKNKSCFSCDWASWLRKCLLWIQYPSVSNISESQCKEFFSVCKICWIDNTEITETYI